MFDPETFLNTTIETPLSTRIPNIPEGEYTGMIRESKDMSVREIETRDKKKQLILDLRWGTDDPQAVAATSMQWSTARQSIFIDLTPSGGIASGEADNTQLGRLREALGQNQNGKPWSFHMLVGVPARFTVKHKTNDDGQTFANVTKVAPLHGG